MRRRTVASSVGWTCTPKVFQSSGVELLDPSIALDEETLPTYQPEKYYPVNQGELLNDRYQALPKIGYGVTSTVWLAKDLTASTYVVLKVRVTGRTRNHERELRIYKQMNVKQSKHPGRIFVRKLLDHFDIQGPHGRHVCLVHESLGMSANVLLKMTPGQVMTLDDMKAGIRQLLIALDFLHSEYHIIHTDRTIYNDDIMPSAYRAPDMMLRSSWGYKVDIWNIAMPAWDIVSPRTLISGRNSDGIFDDRVHMAELVALLGPPPPDFREQRPLSSAFWDDLGNWKSIKGEDKEGFLRWLRMALQWNLEHRPTALGLLYDEWLMKGLGE
ncbi:putative protein kinase [Aspergillus homomorphus CBS 101889]|uniref:non-specific serine/threonine protein kinase n=1 Tax=Aspergillus homomorphus (strain CBS 101889) TaxID=1450537 RepID=A0A395HLH4_ASPHC|nr:kinase-like protein [Aspergillus homomorphus CBS 101889]RAL08329.1 kinase-like protein [Aspergillus homomorphus CBS 101889]